MNVTINIDGRELSVPEGLPIRKAALKNGIYIPGICGHPYLPPVAKTKFAEKVYRGEECIIGEFPSEVAGERANCNLCLVQVKGCDELQRACETKASEGMVVTTNSPEITRARRQALAKILAHHPHACLTCAQKEGCSLTQCSSNVPEDERCCILLNRCELGKIVDYVGLPDETPKYINENFPVITGDSFFERDYNLCISCLRCVRVCNDIRGVEVMQAVFKDDRIWVGTANPGLLNESYCKFCGACIEVCPTGALRDKPDSHPVHFKELPPCVEACPAGIDIPAYLRHIAEGDYSGALEVIYDRVPFPGILGYVCFHPCEEVCKRDTLDESIAICALKRFAYENAPDKNLLKIDRAQDSGKKVAIIGSGPAGLSAAFYLRKTGHQVEIFEVADKSGGMLRYGIPEYRLPEKVLEDELQPLFQLGVKFNTNKRLGRDFTIKEIIDDSFDAVLLAIGVNESKRLNIPGADFPGIWTALEFLNLVRKGKTPKLQGRVIVIGGGNVAIDAAMTARRLGSSDVTIVCLEQPAEMPAHSWEIEQAEAEGIVIKHGWGPAEFLTGGDLLKGIKFKQCTRVFDDKGKFNPRYDETPTFNLETDYAILAIGQNVDAESLHGIEELKLGPGNTVKVDLKKYTTNISGLFAAGDVIRGPSSVIDAIADGRNAADAIDRFLGGAGLSPDRKADELSNNPFLGKDAQFHQYKAVKPRQTAPDARVNSFVCIEETLTPEEAQAEAVRCLRCHLRALITPVFLPPDKWQPLTSENIEIVPDSEGVYQLAGSDKKVTGISGTANLKTALLEELEKVQEEVLFCWEEDKMYSKRESELLQKYLQEHGEMPSGGVDDLDDLF